MRRLIATAGLLALMTAPALSYQVYSGCAIPPSSGGNQWWVDPVNGKSPAAGGLGTQAAPWDSLNGVMSGTWATAGVGFAGYTRPLLSSIPYYHIVNGVRVNVADLIGNPPVHPGDTINLMTGAYGDYSIGVYNMETVNSDWVTLKAPTGQTPTFTTLYIRSVNKLVFDGLKVQSLTGTNKNNFGLISVFDQGINFPAQDIIFSNMEVSSADDASAWTKAQWVSQARTFGLNATGSAGSGTNGQPYNTCIAFEGSHIFNIKNGAILFANNLLFAGNEIDHFGDDGIDYAASNLAILRNDEHDNLDIGDGNHEDAMQGQIGPKLSTVPFNHFSNILIDGNTIIRQLDSKLAFPTYLQGIDAFDADWTNLTVTNNIIVTSACWGTYFSSVHNILIAGNTVLEDGLIAAPGCTVWLQAGGSSHEGPPSTNIRVTNNLAEHFAMGAAGEPLPAYDHNVALNSYQPFANPINTKPPGVDANGNVSFAVSVPYASVFQMWDPAILCFNLMLKPRSVAIGPGIALAGLPTDIAGLPRSAPFTVGAYGFPY
jgi:hypothetical protein